MTDIDTPTQPLVGASSHTAVDVGAPEDPRSSRAYKVAGFTLLACVLIVGQAAIAYFLLSQNSDIKSLQEDNNKMKTQLTNVSCSAMLPARMHMSMNTFSNVILTSSVDLKMAALSDAPLTACQQEAAGLKTVSVPGFRPSCDSRGQYMPQQCFKTLCWCVNPVNGEQIKGSEGSNHCSTRVFAGEEDIFNVKIIQLFAFLARKE
uniref:Thyroglobulin type-1 domain-containing protein n=1 Tax=Oryzias latipes TaxID=8090 RepID=A0A3P9IBZ3_ORYLA